MTAARLLSHGAGERLVAGGGIAAFVAGCTVGYWHDFPLIGTAALGFFAGWFVSSRLRAALLPLGGSSDGRRARDAAATVNALLAERDNLKRQLVGEQRSRRAAEQFGREDACRSWRPQYEQLASERDGLRVRLGEAGERITALVREYEGERSKAASIINGLIRERDASRRDPPGAQLALEILMMPGVKNALRKALHPDGKPGPAAPYNERFRKLVAAYEAIERR